MGNGRSCRNLVENAMLGYAARVYGSGKTDPKDYVLREDDFTAPEMPVIRKKNPIGFGE